MLEEQAAHARHWVSETSRDHWLVSLGQGQVDSIREGGRAQGRGKVARADLCVARSGDRFQEDSLGPGGNIRLESMGARWLAERP